MSQRTILVRFRVERNSLEEADESFEGLLRIRSNQSLKLPKKWATSPTRNRIRETNAVPK